MRRILLTLLALCLLLPAAHAETALVPDYYAPVNPSLTRMTPESGRHVTAIKHSAYLDANEIWYSFDPGLEESRIVLERRDKWGAPRGTVTLEGFNDDTMTKCITRVGNRVMIGVTSPVRGTVIVLDENMRELIRVTLAESVGIMSMTPAPGGILCSGFAFEGTQDCFYVSLVDAEGHISFENKIPVGESEIDLTAVAESVSCAGESGYYAMISKRTGGWLSTRERSVAGFDADGQLRWEDALPETIYACGIVAADGVVYVHGGWSEMDEYGSQDWDNMQAWVGAWSEDGECLWQRIFEAPQRFTVCAADESGCYLVGPQLFEPDNIPAFMPLCVASLTREGELRSMARLQMPLDVCLEGLAIDGRTLQMMGYLRNEETLFYLEVR